MKIKVITKLPNSEQSYKGKVQTHNYFNRQNQSTTGKLWKYTQSRKGWVENIRNLVFFIEMWSECIVIYEIDRQSRRTSIKDYKIGICCFSAKHAALWRKCKDWLARKQDNVSEWSSMSTFGQWLSKVRWLVCPIPQSVMYNV